MTQVDVAPNYDEDVVDNYNAWQTASATTSGLVGSLYATWVGPPNYSAIAPFGELWWLVEQE